MALALLATATLVQGAAKESPKTGPWLKVARSANGFLVGGYLDGVLYGFEIPGSDIKSVGEGKQPLMTVDGVFFQVRAIPKSEFASLAPDALEAHKRYEQKLQRQSFQGVTFADHDFCDNSKARHGQWMAEVPPDPAPPAAGRTPYQVYVTFEVGDSVLMVGSAYGNDEQKRAVARKIDGICRSFVRER
jgi:hypothetical protein